MIAKAMLAWMMVTMVMSIGAGRASAMPVLQRSPEPPDPEYLAAVARTAEMAWDRDVQQLASGYGLDVVNVTWEDTGRYYGSSVGPNISDVTIQVQHLSAEHGDAELTLMPVIRYPNFTDLSADIPPDRFYLMVGNEDGSALQRVTLTEYLTHLRRYLSSPSSWAGDRSSLMAPRDTHVLVSAQAAFLPVPLQGKAEFNPVIFNYQSYSGDPAVLVIVATREGTSATVIDNVRDAFPSGFSWGQRLFFNQNGERAGFTGERLSDFIAQDEQSSGAPDGTVGGAGESGLNMVLLIQVPLKQKHPLPSYGGEIFEMAPMSAAEDGARSNVEAAVIGHGEVEGPFTELDGLDIERDPNYPIRVTVQFYKATSNGVVSDADMAEIHAQIRRVYDDADYVGSLVVDGATDRPTEYEGPKEEPHGWWSAFWQRFAENTGLDESDALTLWRRLRIKARPWWPSPK